jgi:hypothetical protein
MVRIRLHDLRLLRRYEGTRLVELLLQKANVPTAEDQLDIAAKAIGKTRTELAALCKTVRTQCP